MTTTPDPAPTTGRRRIALACQGGGSHTAFTAGVLARLFASDAFDDAEVVAISGTSGGAINALITWAALVRGRTEWVGADLAAFWDDNSARSPAERVLNAVTVGAGVAQSLGLLPPLNPYLLPPAFDGREEFRTLLRRHVDFDALPVDRDAALPLLVLGAVDVLSGEFRAFDSRRDRITPDTVLASAAIPTLFRTIHTDGGAYWDGLFSQNPPVTQLLDARPDEVWVVQINPSRREQEPRTTLDIADRRNELAGNLSLYQELNGIERIDRLLEAGTLDPAGGYRPVVVRVLEMPRTPQTGLLGAASKVNRDAAFLDELRRDGREQADLFLAGLRFERAWNAGDRDAIAAALDGAAITFDDPFPLTPGDRSRPVVDLLAGEVRIDPTGKQVARDQVVWQVRASVGDGPVVAGQVTATFTGDRVRTLHVGPAA